MKFVAILIALITVLYWGFIGKAFGESPEVVSEEVVNEDIITTTTIIAASSPYTTVASASDNFAVFKRFIKEENFTEARQFCHGYLNGDLMEIVRLDLIRNETLSLLTGWVGLGLSNSTFRWFNNETASEIMQCFPGPNPNQSHCVFFELSPTTTTAIMTSSSSISIVDTTSSTEQVSPSDSAKTSSVDSIPAASSKRSFTKRQCDAIKFSSDFRYQYTIP
ncbi:Hypothetical predicted protein [Paramuricea clavata]|uniref:Uncharacterized protein n=1 Tax=Paramuricea clavata TaxID=317549 RepID=A0A6S7GXD3_PARCT|nr:Hypothetical predicted protein [Paramuricea clavata]